MEKAHRSTSAHALIRQCTRLARRLLQAVSVSLCLYLAPLAAVDAAPGVSDIRFLTHNLSDAAFVGDDGLMHGKPHAGRRAYYVEVVMAMMAEADAISPIQEVSLNRGFFLLQNEPNYAFFNLIKNDARAPLYKWVGPIAVFPTYYYELASRPTGVRTIEDTKKVQAICALKGNNLVRLLTNMGHSNILEAPNNETCARMLRFGRVSLITGSEYPWFSGDPELSRLFTRTPVTLSIDEGFIAFSKSVPDDVIATWQRALDSIKADGTYDNVRNRFLKPARLVRKEERLPTGRRRPVRKPQNR